MDVIKTVLTALLSAVALFMIAKLVGHKQLAQLDFFDYINGITIGSIAAELATELESPERPLIALIVYGVISVLLSFITHKMPRARKYVNGSPTILMDGGRIYRENMKKAKIDLSEFSIMCRELGYFDLDDVETAVFEPNGRLSILPRSECRPVTPRDINISPEAEFIKVEVIMDGRIMGENLARRGLNEAWLLSELKSLGYNSQGEIFLGLLDDKNKLHLYPNE